MTTVRRNVAANFAGTAFVGVATLVAAPVYIRFLGAEAYGLIGFHAVMQSLLLLLDCGLTVAVNREIAKLTASGDGVLQARSVMRTAGTVYWIAAVVLAVIVMGAAPLIAQRWLASSVLQPQIVVRCIRLMSIAIAAQFLSMLYGAAFLGLQRHVAYNALLTASVTIRVAAGIAVAIVTRDVVLFFASQAIAGAAQALLFALAVDRILPPGVSRFDRAILRSTWSLAGGVAFINALAAVTTQADKLAVSNTLSLRTFGYYSAASTLALTAMAGAVPIGVAIFPRFSQLLSMQDSAELSLAYHRAMQTLAAIALPVSCVLIVFSREVLFVWTGDPVLASAVWPAAALLIAGAAMNGLLNIPYMLQLAHGWTMPGIVFNAVALVTFVPAMFIGVLRYGTTGAAAVYAFMNLTFLAGGALLTHRRLLVTHGTSWHMSDVIPPFIGGAAVAAVARLALHTGSERLATAAWMALVGSVALAAGVFATPVTREWIAERWRAHRG